MILKNLEQKYDFHYPEVYRRLSESGMLDWGESSADWYQRVFPKLKDNPPLLLFGYDIEIWNDEQSISASIHEMSEEDDYRNIHAGYRFVPFAKNGAGDLYAFQFDLENGGDVPVTFIPHDDEEAEILAKNFQDFIFRQLLEAVVEIDEDSMFYEENEADLKQNLLNQLKTHESYLAPRHIDILNEIYQRGIFEYTYKVPAGNTFEAEGLITFDEMEEILKREIAFDRLNAKFNYTKEIK
ncbi:SMI1/KNR4 family protein [Chryseobacterium viscerum]|uniref:SMI1/KNR4 family protein n=1 Tax=Chryseobacterium viscerum TaxID=1037377 RepID=A0A316WU07_9FLAO|nr:SMI1/KNR4 family protein [Chryseobacterium viscerum]PWN62738.1 SMI1/KNR4 family protein [Chryseobacterium viscerum]